jgi:hypothetical protein
MWVRSAWSSGCTALCVESGVRMSEEIWAGRVAQSAFAVWLAQRARACSSGSLLSIRAVCPISGRVGPLRSPRCLRHCVKARSGVS